MGHSKYSRGYWEALGHFIDEFSHVEMAMHAFLIHRAGVSTEIGNSIFSGTRIADAISFVRRIDAATSSREKVSADLDEILIHLADLNAARNEIVHFGTMDFGQPHRYVSNHPKAHNTNSLKVYVVTAKTLREMTKDAEKIGVSLRRFMLDAAKRKELEGLSKALKRPWLYKRPELLAKRSKKPSNKGRNKATKPSAQPKSSPA